MRLEWLEDILAVAETGSFSEAAERRHLTQSAFSRRIRNIEESLGVTLFDRSKKPATLNPATLDHTDRIAQSAQALRQLILDLKSGDKRSFKRITLVSQHALTTAFIPGFLESVLGASADIFVRVRSGNMDDCFSMILSRKAEIAFVYRLPNGSVPLDATNLELLDIGSERLIPVTASHKAADVLANLDRSPLDIIGYPSDVFLGKIMAHDILPALPFSSQLAPRVETALTLAAAEFAAKGIGVAWVPALLVQTYLADGRLCDLSAHLPGCALSVSAVRIAGKCSPTACALWNQLSDWSAPLTAANPVAGLNRE